MRILDEDLAIYGGGEGGGSEEGEVGGNAATNMYMSYVYVGAFKNPSMTSVTRIEVCFPASLAPTV